ncbi:MAG: hypothetical protein QM777_10745 [Pseudorhodoferax sp.]
MTHTSYDTYRESIAGPRGRGGHARTGRLLPASSNGSQTGALWTVANKIEPWQPKSDVGAGAVALPRPARARAALGGRWSRPRRPGAA